MQETKTREIYKRQLEIFEKAWDIWKDSFSSAE